MHIDLTSFLIKLKFQLALCDADYHQNNKATNYVEENGISTKNCVRSTFSKKYSGGGGGERFSTLNVYIFNNVIITLVYTVVGC